LPIVSDPTDEDTDGDGYADGPIDCFGTGKVNDPRPIVKDVLIYRLRNYEYISVYDDREDKRWTGGSQRWFYDANDPLKNDTVSKQIRGGGCGIIASVDTLIFLEKNLGFNDLTSVDTSADTIDFNDYNRFVRKYARDYLTPFDIETPIQSIGLFFYCLGETLTFGSLGNTITMDEFLGYYNDFSDSISDNTGTWGVNPLSLQFAYNKFLKEKGFTNKTTYYDDNITERTFINNLNQNRPIILFVGPGNEVYFWEKSGTPYWELPKGEREKFGAHYVVVIGMEVDTISGKSTLEICTWGRTAYMEFNNFVGNMGLLGGVITIG
jgi:hypothetical protein